MMARYECHFINTSEINKLVLNWIHLIDFRWKRFLKDAEEERIKVAFLTVVLCYIQPKE